MSERKILITIDLRDEYDWNEYDWDNFVERIHARVKSDFLSEDFTVQEFS